MRLKVLITFLIFFFAFVNVFGQVAKYSNEFLSVGVGARALGMSNSVVATSNDVTSGYWNPSALVLMPEKMQVALMHNEYFAGMAKYDYAGYARKINDSSSIGFSLIRMGVDDIPNTLNLVDNNGNFNYDRISSFSEADYCFLVSYAKKSSIPNLIYGGNVKIIRRIAGDFASAWGFGLDASARYYIGNFNIGIIARDITTTFNAWSFHTSEFETVFKQTGNDIPKNSTEITMPKIILGCSYYTNIYKKFSGLAEVDADISTDGKRNVLVSGDPVSLDPHMGLEFNYNGLVYLRMGLGNIQKIPSFDGKKNLSMQPGIGLGLKYKNFAVDYALCNLDRSIGLYSNVFSLRYSFNKLGKF